MDKPEQRQRAAESSQHTKIKDIMEVQTAHGRLVEKIMVALGLKIEDGPAKITKINSLAERFVDKTHLSIQIREVRQTLINRIEKNTKLDCIARDVQSIQTEMTSLQQ